MDVRSLNKNDRKSKNYENNSFNINSTQFSLETYFIWFSALIFLTEIITDFCLVTFYFHRGHLKWGCITLGIILVPWILCQIYSFIFLRKEQNLTTLAVVLHFLFLGIPYRYYSILSRIDKDKMNSQEYILVKQRIREINSVQIVNAVFQYFPQFLFQAYLISFRKYKCVITGVSAGLAGFSFLWYIFLYFYYVIKRCNEEIKINDDPDESNITNIIDNLSTTSRNMPINSGSSTLTTTSSTIHENLKNFEKKFYQTDNKNLVSKKFTQKNIDKEQIFSFNKRKPIYKQDEFDLYDVNNQSIQFYELNDNSMCSSKVNLTEMDGNGKIVATNKENNPKPGKSEVINEEIADTSRGSLLKRKGICSSTEMLHLVDIMNDQIPPDQIDVLAKSLAEMSGEESLNLSSDCGELDSSKLLEIFPSEIDEKQLENIDAAIYENQIIFQERIRKNQLTIQNLKLQDEILSNDIDMDTKLSSLSNNNETISMHDYENMYFADVNRLNRLKHWRNYLRDLDTNLHDNSTVLNSSFYMYTTTTPSLNSYGELYINEKQLQQSNKLNQQSLSKKNVQWSDKLSMCCDANDDDDDDHHHHHHHDNPEQSHSSINNNNDEEDLYININENRFNPAGTNNILVETINKINADSPIIKQHLSTKLNTENHNLNLPIIHNSSNINDDRLKIINSSKNFDSFIEKI